MSDDLFESEQEILLGKMAKELKEIGQTEMPFGRFSGRKLYDLPAEYLNWFQFHGWPKGRLGHLMQIVHQMKVDGADIAFDRFRTSPPRHSRADE